MRIWHGLTVEPLCQTPKLCLEFPTARLTSQEYGIYKLPPANLTNSITLHHSSKKPCSTARSSTSKYNSSLSVPKAIFQAPPQKKEKMQLPRTLAPAFFSLLTLWAQHTAGLLVPRQEQCSSDVSLCLTVWDDLSRFDTRRCCDNVEGFVNSCIEEYCG